jgi:hypothetical protein
VSGFVLFLPLILPLPPLHYAHKGVQGGVKNNKNQEVNWKALKHAGNADPIYLFKCNPHYYYLLFLFSFRSIATRHHLLLFSSKSNQVCVGNSKEQLL